MSIFNFSGVGTGRSPFATNPTSSTSNSQRSIQRRYTDLPLAARLNSDLPTSRTSTESRSVLGPRLSGVGVQSSDSEPNEFAPKRSRPSDQVSPPTNWVSATEAQGDVMELVSASPTVVVINSHPGFHLRVDVSDMESVHPITPNTGSGQIPFSPKPNVGAWKNGATLSPSGSSQVKSP
ncbi:hypothetical protein EBR57_06590 [bacterium]|nr:hypothetical protein [bacterium]